MVRQIFPMHQNVLRLGYIGSCMICIKWSCVMHQCPKKCIIVCGLGLAMHQFPQLKQPWFTNMPLFGEFETQCYMRCVWGDQRVGFFIDSEFSSLCHMSHVSFWEAVWCFWWEWFSPWLDSPTTRACLSSCSGMARAFAAIILVSNKQLIKEQTNY